MTEPSTTLTLHYGIIVTGVGGGLALFLYGMRKMIRSLKIVAGGGMKKLLSKMTGNRFAGAAAGMVITAVIQSSSVTTVLVVGFISARLMTFAQSLGVIIGADIGTTITAQIIAFRITEYALPMIAAGFLMEIIGRNEKVRHYGTAIMGLGLLFFGMELMSDATRPLQSYQPFVSAMREMKNPLLGILIGTIFTAIVQSSSATTGVIIVLAGQGFMSLETGIALVFGANIGTCVTAVLSALGKPHEAMQAAAAHVVFKVLGVLIWLAFIPQFAEMVRLISPSAPDLVGIARSAAETPRQIANAHTLFNVANGMFFIWLTGPIGRFVCRVVPERKGVETTQIQPVYLDEYYLEQPDLALDRTKMELMRMGVIVLRMQQQSFSAVTAGDKRELSRLQLLDDDVDILHQEIIAYLGELSLQNLVDPQPSRIYRQIAVAGYLENIGDIVETTLVGQGNKRLFSGIEVDRAFVESLRPIHEKISRTFEETLDAFERLDVEKAAKIRETESEFKELLDRARNNLVANLVFPKEQHYALFGLANEIMLCFDRIHSLCRRIATIIEQAEETSAPA